MLVLCGHLKVFVSIAVTASSFQSTNFPGENLKFVKMQVFIYNKHEWKFSEDQQNSSYLLSLIRRISSNTYITAVRTFLQFCKRYLLMFEKHFWFIVRLIHRLFEAVYLKVFLIDIIFDIQFMTFYFLIIWFLTFHFFFWHSFLALHFSHLKFLNGILIDMAIFTNAGLKSQIWWPFREIGIYNK